MRCGVIARKLGMSRTFNDKGEHVPVTVLRLEDVEVLSIKSMEKDGYIAVQLGFNNKKLKNINKPLKEHQHYHQLHQNLITYETFQHQYMLS